MTDTRFIKHYPNETKKTRLTTAQLGGIEARYNYLESLFDGDSGYPETLTFTPDDEITDLETLWTELVKLWVRLERYMNCFETEDDLDDTVNGRRAYSLLINIRSDVENWVDPMMEREL